MADYYAAFPDDKTAIKDVDEALTKHITKLQAKHTELATEVAELEKEIATEGGNTQKTKEKEGKQEKLDEQVLFTVSLHYSRY